MMITIQTTIYSFDYIIFVSISSIQSLLLLVLPNNTLWVYLFGSAAVM